jgi:hypothetical protein
LKDKGLAAENGDIFVSAEIVARVLGVSSRTVERWAAGADLPRVSPGRYSLAAVVRWFVAREVWRERARHQPRCVSLLLPRLQLDRLTTLEGI